MTFTLQKLLIFMGSHLLIVALNAHANSVLFRKSFPVMSIINVRVCFLDTAEKDGSSFHNHFVNL